MSWKCEFVLHSTIFFQNLFVKCLRYDNIDRWIDCRYHILIKEITYKEKMFCQSVNSVNFIWFKQCISSMLYYTRYDVSCV